MDPLIPRRTVLFAAAAASLGLGVQRGAAQAPAPTASLAADLAAMREEEKLARDVYRALGARWGLPVFSNIASAEQRHFDHVGALLAARGLPDPARDGEGLFADDRFTALHAELVAQGLRSELDALRVGARIEELDIADLDALIVRTSEPDVRRVYELLRCGSRNHLRAFDALLRERGATYVPVHLGEERYREIAAGEHERCGRMFGGGGGWGGGRGAGRRSRGGR